MKLILSLACLLLPCLSLAQTPRVASLRLQLLNSVNSAPYWTIQGKEYQTGKSCKVIVQVETKPSGLLMIESTDQRGQALRVSLGAQGAYNPANPLAQIWKDHLLHWEVLPDAVFRLHILSHHRSVPNQQEALVYISKEVISITRGHSSVVCVNTQNEG